MNPAPSSGTGLSVSCVSGPSALELVTTTAFERDLRRVRKQGKDLDKLEAVVEVLLARQPLPVRCGAHLLRGEWAGHWDCHVSLRTIQIA